MIHTLCCISMCVLKWTTGHCVCVRDSKQWWRDVHLWQCHRGNTVSAGRYRIRHMLLEIWLTRAAHAHTHTHTHNMKIFPASLTAPHQWLRAGASMVRLRHCLSLHNWRHSADGKYFEGALIILGEEDILVSGVRNFFHVPLLHSQCSQNKFLLFQIFHTRRSQLTSCLYCRRKLANCNWKQGAKYTMGFMNFISVAKK